MTKDQMIEELVEFDLTQVSVTEICQVFLQAQRIAYAENYTDEEIKSRYTSFFGDEEVVH